VGGCEAFHVVANTNHVKLWRRVAIRYEKSVANDQARLMLDAILLLLYGAAARRRSTGRC
jgi:hypothetical protein